MTQAALGMSHQMYSTPRGSVDRPRLSNRGYYSDLTDRSMYYHRRSLGNIDDGEDIDAELEETECV